jgi:hypothetical protein
MDLYRYILGSSVIVIFFALILLIYSLVYLKGLIQKRERGFESNLAICQLLLNITSLICVCKIITLLSGTIYLDEDSSLYETIERYFNESNTFLFYSLGIITFFIVISKLRFKEKFPRNWYKYVNFVIAPTVVIILHTSILALIIKAAPPNEAEVTVDEKMDVGILEDGIFKNEYFNFSMKVSSDWFIVNDLIKKMSENRADSLLKNKDDAEELLAAIEENCTHLSIARHDPQLMPFNNYSLICMSMNLGKSHGYNYSHEFMGFVKKEIKRTLINVNFYGDIQEAKFKGQNLSFIKYSMDVSGRTIFQEYFATLKNQYALAFVISYSNDDERAVLLETLLTTTFSQSNSE